MTGYHTTNTTCANCNAAAEAAAEAAAAAEEARIAAAQTRCNEKNSFCLNLVLGFLGMLLAFTTGLIMGALLSWIVIISLPAIIVFAIVLAVLIISLLIYKWCRKDRSQTCCRCCCK